MSNIPKYIEQLRDLGIKRNELGSELQKIDQEINKITVTWQGECEHPDSYRANGQCSACGYMFEKGDENGSVSN